ncbi:MAG: phytoene desaturase [Candidatus Methanofastidiosum sp.]|nr:phytoene desaturase [Methanofastidiosum sp.]
MKIVVVGTGFGGLSAAALLAKNGFDVTVLEKNDHPGGRASVYSEKKFYFDMGPSWYLMPDVFENFYAQFGKKPEDFFELKKLDPSYRIYFGGEKVIDISADLEKNFALFDTFEKDGGKKLQKYLESAGKMYEVSIKELMYRDYRTIFDFMDPKLMSQGLKLNLLDNLDKFVSKHFESDEAKKIVEYSIGFLGSSPHNTPSFYHIMSHIDLTLGVWYPEGGMRKVADSVYRLAMSYGAKFHFDEPVVKIEVEDKKATRVITGKNSYNADLVIVNADYAHAELDLIDREYNTYSEQYWDKRVMAPSALVAYVGVDKKFDELAHHTLFLDKDWSKGFDTLFDPKKAAWPENPSYYVNVPSKTDTTAAPKGMDTLFILVPLAPGLKDTPEMREQFYNKIMDNLEKTIGQNIRDHIVVKRIFALTDFKERYNAYKGTALGLSHTMMQTALFRPSHKSKKVKNLYYSGHYTHPGIGVPMTLISSQIVAEEIIKEYK